jgi:membrane-associated protease RseP (regulator of RpoE activity)
VGKVALDRSDLSLDHLRHDWGVGLFARIGGREVARIYLGFGMYGFSWKRSEGLKSLGGLADRSIWSETGEQGTPTLDFSRQD